MYSSTNIMKKVIICGFPHCGTTILKSIIGHMPNVKEIIKERKRFLEEDLDSSFDFVLCKTPWAPNSLFHDSHFDDYIKIFIIRNPLWIFSSLNKRCDNPKDNGIPEDHSVSKYIDTAERWLSFIGSKREDIFLLKYENMFANDFAVLRQIFDQIGFTYTNEVFQNDKFRNFSHEHQNSEHIPKSLSCSKEHKWVNVDHENYRLWQINQPIQNMNTLDKLDYLLPEQISQLQKSQVVMQLYPEIPKLLSQRVISSTT